MGNYTNTIPNLQIEALLSVSPSKLTDPRQVRGVSTAGSGDPFGSDILGGCLNVLLYYNRACQEDSGWLHAGWIKESLGKALLEQPIFCGRLRKTEARSAADGDKRLEIVSNDSGIRLIEARMPVTLSEFLGSKSRHEAETELVFWKDIDREDPNFSPLFYLQVTNFECGGYSFGISCSLLLADFLFNGNFLKRWAEIHNTMLSSPKTKSPIYYLPKFKRDGSSIPGVFGSSPSKKSGQTMIFDARNSEKELAITSSLALLCVEEVESKLGYDYDKISSEYFSLFVNEPGNVKIEKCSKLGIINKAKLSLNNMGVTSSSWDEVGAHEVEFREGNKPVHVSFWIGSSDQIVMAIPSSEKGISGMKIIVAVPN
ncbi:uncharacterized protein LOC21406783 isoform X2 [Morus notabilis]|uniref:uncharacterized protein LOC21406783 isoform X1 n=1 Tax=Morus notabilis TaxID=981085 RepID=UPI000CED1F92|nr:uncharacterized protein LOC21406783 isoform X1 [Morus notabilis]XP_024026879.1 uncharacterized protein LOC21406783 isoform X2 [Morus notabilis]